MRVAVVSDIHANYHALEAVLAAISVENVDEVWCLGDTVGYGPRPNRCCAVIRERAAFCLIGNHDLAALGELPLETFNDDAAAAARWTQATLERDGRAFLAALAPSGARVGAELFHASPLDPVWDYVLSRDGARLSLLATQAPLVLVGHSHVQLAFGSDHGPVAGGVASDGQEIDLSQGRWLLNPGSVGQPRGGDPRAAWLLIDQDARRATFRRTPYPIERTQGEMQLRGLPDSLASRLEHGI
jgi:predicted phosphodiesterase